MRISLNQPSPGFLPTSCVGRDRLRLHFGFADSGFLFGFADSGFYSASPNSSNQ